MSNQGRFPQVRGRRLRGTPSLRAALAETTVEPAQLVHPLFVVEGTGVRREIAVMPGQFHLSADVAAEEAKEIEAAGVGGVILFGLPAAKDPIGSSAHDTEGPVCRSIEAIKRSANDLVVWADVCLCEYTDHGHCGVIDAGNGTVANDATLPQLASAAHAYATAGADVVAPSDMMDGRVRAIRTALDDVGLHDTIIVSYAAKYASAYYGPFRDAAESAPEFGDRRTYQMDPPNAREALHEVALDLAEGADAVMVKPAGPYLDIVRRVADTIDVPVAAYQVSGEYSMITAAAERGWIDLDRVIAESLIGIRRAGAQIVLTYFAKKFALAASRR